MCLRSVRTLLVFKMNLQVRLMRLFCWEKILLYKKCKNKDEYIRKAAPALLGFGLVAACVWRT